jgi:hypothetical protein
MKTNLAGASPVDQSVRPLIAKLRAMQLPGAESELTVMCWDAAEALTELEEWRKLRDPVTLHVSLLRGIPARLSRETLLHMAGADQLRAALLALAHAADDVGVAHFDSDDLPPAVQALQDATAAARVALGA